jgi:hypothetical protein
MSPAAMRAWTLDLTLGIDDLGHDFKVVRVDAEGVATQMIKNHVGRDLDSMGQLVGDTMGLHDSPTRPESAIAGRLGLREVPAC